MRLPERIVHSDWSADPSKRWGAEATLDGGRYLVRSPHVVTDPVAAAVGVAGTTLLGFDFPIGIPWAYARRAGIASFLELLPVLGRGAWCDFFTPAETHGQISLHRPFYPRRPGGTSQRHLLEALGFTAMDELRRVCEHAAGGRRAAQVLFWTLGPNQVGRAAIAGWRELLIPRREQLRLWPFAGSLEELLGGDRAVVVCETYPAEFYGQLGLPRDKTRAARRRAAPALVAAADRLGVGIGGDLEREICCGFANDDAYDAFVGVLGMLNVVAGERGAAPPLDDQVRSVEGWILGQAA